MIRLIYSVPEAKEAEELAWLRDQKIFPAVESFFDWKRGINMVRFGMIVSPAAALTVKLRHDGVFQDKYS